jgi:hypothetical protein
MKFDDFFETVQDVKTRPESSWQFLAHFLTKKGAAQPPPEVSATTGKASRLPSQVGDQGPLVFDLVDQGGPEDFDDEPESTPPPASLPPEGESIPAEPPDPERHRHPESTRRSSRQSVPPRRLIKTAYAALDDTDAVEDYETQNLAEDPIAFATSKSDPDTMHCGQAMKADDAVEFKQVMLREVDAHTKQEHWEVWAKADVPPDQDILPSAWNFKRKRRIDTREVYKYKARINAHGGKQTHGVNYWETYSPVVNCIGTPAQACRILSRLVGLT